MNVKLIMQNGRERSANGSARPSPRAATDDGHVRIRFYQTLKRRSQIKAIQQDAELCGQCVVGQTRRPSQIRF